MGGPPSGIEPQTGFKNLTVHVTVNFTQKDGTQKDFGNF